MTRVLLWIMMRAANLAIMTKARLCKLIQDLQSNRRWQSHRRGRKLRELILLNMLFLNIEKHLIKKQQTKGMREKLRPLRMKTYFQQEGYRRTEVVLKEKFRRKKAQSLQRRQFKIPLMQLLLTQFVQSRDLFSKKYQILKTISAIVRQMTTKVLEM